MKEYKLGNAIVRMHGEPNIELCKKATADFLKKVMENKKRKGDKDKQ